jgi:hypothetical protein
MPSILAKPEKQSRTAPSVRTETRMTTNPRQYQNSNTLGRPEGFLETFIRDDKAFSTQMGNAYAQAWALSFWLIETRPREYAKFLQKMASPEVARQLTPESRVKLFKESFGDNLILLDAELLRYYARIK